MLKQLCNNIVSLQVCKLGLLPHLRSSSLVSYDVIYSTQTTLAVQAVGSPSSTATHFLTSEGEMGSSHINTFDHTPQTVACATSSHGYHVQLFDLHTAAHLSTLKGHFQPVTAINIRQSPPNCIVTGSVDKRCGVCVWVYVCVSACVYASVYECGGEFFDDIIVLLFGPRVCVYDYVRCPQPVMKLSGHSDVIRSVQMNEWKVVSGR